MKRALMLRRRAARSMYWLVSSLALAGIISRAGIAHAATGIWGVGSGEWTNAANWTTGVVPNAVDDRAIFQSVLSPAGTVIVTLASPVTVAGITFDAPSAYRLDAAGTVSTLTLASTMGSASILVTAVAGTNATTFTLPVTLGSDLSIANNATGAVVFSGVISGTGNLTLNGTGEVSLRGNNAAWNPVSITVNAGVLSSTTGTLTSFGNPATGTITVKSGASLDVSGILTNPTAQQFAKTLVLTGAGTSGSAGALAYGGTSNTLAGAVTIDGPTTFLAKSGAATLHLGSPLGNNSAASLTGAGTLIKTGVGTLQLNLAAGHTGGTLVSAGTLTVSPLGSLVGTGNVSVNTGGRLVIGKPAGSDAASASVSLNAVVLGGGVLAIGANISLANLLSASTTSGIVSIDTAVPFTAGGTNVVDFSTLQGGAIIRVAGAANTSLPATLTMIPESTTRTLRFGGGTGLFTLNNALQDFNGNPTNVEFSTGTQAIALAGSANSYTGFTFLNSGANVTVTAVNALGSPLGATTVNAGGTLTLSAASPEPVTVNGGVLAVNANTSGALSIKSGTMNLLAAANSPITQTGGVVNVNAAYASPISISGGTLTIATSSTAPLTVLGGLVNFNAAGNESMNISGGTVTLNAASSGALALSGSGVLRVVGANPANATLTMAGGRLSLATNVNFATFLAPGSTGGVVSIDTATVFTAGGTNSINFATLPGGAGLSLATTVVASIGSAVQLRPDAATNTLRFGATGATGTLTLNAALVDFAGVPTNVAYNSQTTIILPATNSSNTYTGTTTVGTRLQVLHASGLGAGDGTDATATILNPGGTLTTGPGVTLLNEKLITNGGTIEANSGGPVMVNATAFIGGTLTGTISGAGNINVNTLLALSGTNNFTGAVSVLNGLLFVTSDSGLGSPLTGTTVDGGTLTLSAPSAEPVTTNNGAFIIAAPFSGVSNVTGGTMVVNSVVSMPLTISGGSISLSRATDVPVTATGGVVTLGDIVNIQSGALSLTNASFVGFGNGLMRVAGAITTAGTSTIAGGASSFAQMQIGGISGTGNLTVSGGSNSLLVNGPTTFAGYLLAIGPIQFSNVNTSGVFAARGGTVTMGTTWQHSGTAYITNSALTLAGTSSTVTGPMAINFSTVNINNVTSVGRLILGAGNLNGAGTLNIASQQVEFYGGKFNFTGSMPGVTEITKQSVASGAIGALPSGFTGPINLKQGELQVTAALGTGVSPIHLPATGGTLRLMNATLANPINFNVLAPVVASLTPTMLLGTGTLMGALNFGAPGAVLSGALTVSGAVSGGKVVTSGDITFESAAAYTGSTTVEGRFTLRGNGTVASTAPIALQSGALLYLHDFTTFLPDRVPDTTPIMMTSASVLLDGLPSFAITTTETLGAVTAVRGINEFSVKKNQEGGTGVRLTLSSLTRIPGAVVSFTGGGSISGLGFFADDPQLLITEQPDSTFLGGGMIYNDGGNKEYAKYTAARGVSKFVDSDYFEGAESAWTPTSVPRINSGIVTLTADRTVASVKLTGKLDLTSHVLNLSGGGLIMADGAQVLGTAGSRLTAGGNAPAAELFFHAGSGQFSTRTIAANITDNPGLDGQYDPVPGGPLDADNGHVNVVFSTASNYVLSGTNTYSGTTYINSGQVSVNSAAAVAPGAIVVTNGGYNVNGSFNAMTGTVTLRAGNVNGTGSIQPAAMNIESGTLTIPILGAGPLTKTTGGLAELSDIKNFSGAISIQGGYVQIFGGSFSGRVTLPHTINLQSGTLALTTNTTLTGNLTFGDDSVIAGNTGLILSPASLTLGTNVTLFASSFVPASPAALVDSIDPSRRLNLAVSGGLSFNPGTYQINTFSGGNTNVPAGVTMVVDNTQLSDLGVLGVLSLRSNAAGPVSKVGTLTLGGATNAWTGKIDIGDRALILQPNVNRAVIVAQVRNQIQTGFNGGDWLGNGITSSAAAANPTGLAVAVVDPRELQLVTFKGELVDDNSLIITLAHIADTNLDNKVDALDLNTLAGHWQQGNAVWSSGDFNSDGQVNAFDLNLLAANWQFGTGGGGSLEAALAGFPALAAAVPEPASIMLISLMAPLLLRRRRV